MPLLSFRSAAIAFAAALVFTACHRSVAGPQAISYPSDGLQITGLQCLTAASAAKHPIILINHGGFDPASSVAPLLELFAKVGYIAIASDYRGVGQSQGKREVAAGEVNDILNAVAYAKALPDADAQHIVMLGFSHGGAIALHVAARSREIAGVVTVGAPMELAECYQHWVETVDHAPFLRPLIGISIYIGGTPAAVPDRWRARSPLYVAEKITCPVMLIQGGKDPAVPPAQAGRMADALRAGGNQQVELVLDPEAAHVLDKPAYDRLGKRMINFLNRQCALPPLP